MKLLKFVVAWIADDLDCTKANYLKCAGDTAEVTNYPAGASPYGMLDLAGNVWEWVADWYQPDYYAHAPALNPMGPETGEFRVRRGGDWNSLASHLRVTVRASGSPRHYFDGQMGFRCALSASALSSK